MRRHKPCRASARWMEGAPPEVLSVQRSPEYPNDEFTVYLQPYHVENYGLLSGWWIPYLALSASGAWYSGEGTAWDLSERSRGRIAWADLPEPVKATVRWWIQWDPDAELEAAKTEESEHA